MELGEHGISFGDGRYGAVDESSDTGRWEAGRRGIERALWQVVPPGESRVGSFRTPIRGLDRAEELLLESIGRTRAELFIGPSEGRERGSAVVNRLAKRVEQLLPGFTGDVGHLGEVSCDLRYGPRG